MLRVCALVVLLFSMVLPAEEAADSTTPPKKKKDRLIVIGRDGVEINGADREEPEEQPRFGAGWSHGLSFRARPCSKVWLGASFYGQALLGGESEDQKEPLETRLIVFSGKSGTDGFHAGPFAEIAAIHYPDPTDNIRNKGRLTLGVLPQFYMGPLELEWGMGFRVILVDLLEEGYRVKFENDFDVQFGVFYLF